MSPTSSTPTAATPATPNPRRRGLTVPLPAVVVGLGLASAPAVAQIPVVARNDFYTVPPDTQSTLLVLANDTLNNVLPTTFYSISPTIGNAIAQTFSILYAPPPGYTGPASFRYCIRTGFPLSNSCATVSLLVAGPSTPVPALGGAALVGLSGVLGWLGMRLRRRG